MKLLEIEKTCDACPSQWDAELADGRNVYIRYRWGWFQVSISRDVGGDPHESNRHYHEQREGDEFDGFMTTAEMLTLVENLPTPELEKLTAPPVEVKP